MPRSALLVVAAAAVTLAAVALGGCRPAADAQPLGSPREPETGVARTEVDGSPAEPGPARSGSAGGSEPASSLVAVAMTQSGEPCERVCGSLGDCLLADDAYSSAVAGRLELSCLDLCVHAPDGDPAKRELLGCGGQACGELTACAERNWATLSAASSRVEPQPIATSGDPCVESCLWMFSCSASFQPPDQTNTDPGWERDCAQQCEEEIWRTMMMHMGPCVVNHCSDVNAVYECYSAATNH
jgi:hypothetical protein